MKTFADFGIDLGDCTGVEVQSLCPQCSPLRKKSKAKCLSVNTVENMWICHHCDWRGSLKGGEESPARPPKRLVKPHYEKPSAIPSHVKDWFAKRGIPEAVVLRNGIGVASRYVRDLEAEAECVTFPYFKRGEVVNIKYRSAGKHFSQCKDAEKVLYGLDDTLTEDWAVLVEGELDKLSLEVAGIRNAVSVPDGAPPAGSKPSDAKFEYLVNCQEQLNRLKKLILAVDADAPGKTLEEELARRLGPERCWRVVWPEGCKDANDALLKHGPDVLRQCIKTAKPYPLEGVLEVADLYSDIVDLYERGLPGGLSTGWASVDPYYSVRYGEMTITTGIPSHGKSEFIDALIVNLAERHGTVTAICSPENFPVSRHVAKLLEKYVGLPFRSGPTRRMTMNQLDEGMRWVHEHFIFIAPEDAVTIPSLLTTAKQLVTRYGIRGLVIDPWNEFDHRRPANITETEYVSQSLGAIRRFARNYGVHVWIVAHPMKLQRLKDTTGNLAGYPVPTPYDISGSAHWRNKADACLCVWRDQLIEDNVVQLHVQKIRFRENGRVGMVKLRWDSANGRYSAVDTATPLHRTTVMEEIDLEN